MFNNLVLRQNEGKMLFERIIVCPNREEAQLLIQFCLNNDIDFAFIKKDKDEIYIMNKDVKTIADGIKAFVEYDTKKYGKVGD